MSRVNIVSGKLKRMQAYGGLCVECNEAGGKVEIEPRPADFVLIVGRAPTPICRVCVKRVMEQIGGALKGELPG